MWPVLGGDASRVVDRFRAGGRHEANVVCARDTWVFEFDGPAPAFLESFRSWYGPTMNAFAAAEADGRADDLRDELTTLFKEHNLSDDPEHSTRFEANYLRVTVRV